MTRTLKMRLCAMMFLQYAVPAATIAIFSYYLKTCLGFEPWQAGLVMAMPGVAALIAPLAASHIADRYLSAERLLVVCHLLSAVLMWWLSRLSGFSAVLMVYFLYGVCLTPTFGLTNTVALHHTRDAERDFGGIRMWGTIGWVVVAWAFGYWWLGGGEGGGERLPHALIVSALTSVTLALFSLGFKPSLERAGQPIRYREVLRVFATPSMVLLCVVTFLYNVCHQFYYFGMGLHLNQLGFADEHILPAISFGQINEIVVLGTLGWCLARLGMKRAMIIGILAQALRFVIFAWEGPTITILAGIGLHGISYAFYFTTAYLYVDRHSTPATRAGAQQVLTLMIAGFGLLAGFVLAGQTAQYFQQPDGLVDFSKFWLAPMVLCLVIAGALAIWFHEEPPVNGGNGVRE